MDKKKVLISHAWADSDVPHLPDFIHSLEERGCEVVVYPYATGMSEEDIMEWAKGCYAHVCGGVKYTARVMDALLTMASSRYICAESPIKTSFRSRHRANELTPGILSHAPSYFTPSRPAKRIIYRSRAIQRITNNNSTNG